MRVRTLLGIIIIFFLFGVSSGSATVWVDDDSSCGRKSPCYSSIQWAVDNATAGDTIIVMDGIYQENVVVDVSDLTIKSENGSTYTTIDGGGSGDVVDITADNVIIEGFTITGSGDEWPDGGLEISSSGNTVNSNNISKNRVGIRLESSSNNSITSNNIYSNNYKGIYLWWYCDNNSITSNNIYSNNAEGIFLDRSENNSITSNNISNNDEGIYLWLCSDNNSITSNNISNNSYGIRLESSSNNLSSNSVSNNYRGIHLDSSSNNSITSNDISNNSYGIYLWECCQKNSITSNNIFSNNWVGIYLFSSSNNLIYLNNINNTDNFDSSGSTNIWNSTEEITYAYFGETFKNRLGNYWSDYTGSESNGDGVGDISYGIDGDEDNYPLAQPFENYIRTAALPSAPQNLQANAADGQIDLTWSVPSDDGDSSIINYKVYRGTGGENSVVAIVNGTSYNDIGLINGQTYYYQVSAVNSVGEGPKSSEVKATTVSIGETRDDINETQEERIISEYAKGTYNCLDVPVQGPLPISWIENPREKNQETGNYTFPSEIGNQMVVHLGAKEMNYTSEEKAWSDIEEIIDQLILFQNSGKSYQNSVFYRAYWTNRLNPTVGQSDYDHNVSSIDNAILAADLIVIREAAEKEGRQNIADKADMILSKMDFSMWLNETTDLFYMGAPYNPKAGNVWDYYSNEGRLIPVIAYALGNINKEQFEECLDSFIKNSGTYKGITVENVNYGGASFTYYLPALYLNEMDTSYGDTTIIPMFKAQMKYAEEKGLDVWGRSDITFNDQYLNLGTPPSPGAKLENPYVVTPYASYFAILSSELKNETIANVVDLQENYQGFYDSKYGFSSAINAKTGVFSNRHETWANQLIFLTEMDRFNGMIWDLFHRNQKIQEAYRMMYPERGGISVPHFIDFGSVEVGNSANETLTISNNGTENLTVDIITFNGTEFNLIDDKCSGKTLSPSESCDINISFIPASKGSKSAKLNITSNDPNNPYTIVELRGIGVDTPPMISLIDPTLPNNTITNELYLSINVTSNEPLSTCLLEWDGTNMSMDGSGISWYFNQTLNEGEHYYRVCGNDSVNNWNCTSRVIIVDRTSPILSNLTTDPAIPEVNSTVNVSVNVDDPYLHTVRANLTYPNGTSSTKNMITKDNVTFNLSFLANAYGNYRVEIVAQDLAGNINTTHTGFVAVMPAFNSTTILNGSTATLIKNPNIIINVTANETANGEVIIHANVSSSPTIFNLIGINNTSGAAGIKYLNITSPVLNNINRIRIQLHYTDDEIPSLLEENSMAIFYWNGSAWVNCSNHIGETVPDGPFVFNAGNNPNHNYAYALVNHTSYYGLGGYLDSDEDGILDINDGCPNDPENYNGYQDDDGCPDTKPTPTPVRRSGGGGGGGGLTPLTPTNTPAPTITPKETPSVSITPIPSTPEETQTTIPTQTPTATPKPIPTGTSPPNLEKIIGIALIIAAIVILVYLSRKR